MEHIISINFWSFFCSHLDSEINNNNITETESTSNSVAAEKDSSASSSHSHQHQTSNLNYNNHENENGGDHRLIDTDELINLSFLKKSTKLNSGANKLLNNNSHLIRDDQNSEFNSSITNNNNNNLLTNYFAQMNSDNFNLIPDAKQLQMAVLG